MEFFEHMSQACADYEAGFHFEEGGCAGMAIAIHEALAQRGETPSYVSFKNTCHIAVLNSGQLIDHSGATPSKAEFEHISEDQLFALAKDWGCHLAADLEWARAIVSRAHELSERPSP
jgi:hypothetical protein